MNKLFFVNTINNKLKCHKCRDMGILRVNSALQGEGMVSMQK